MKKFLTVLTAAAFIVGFSACKKEYTCCYYDADGEKFEFGGSSACTTPTKMSKSDMEDLESDMKEAAKAWDGDAKCE